MIKWCDAQAIKKGQTSVLSQIQSHHAAEVVDYRRYLQIIVETVAYLGKQNIAFRGHAEDRTSLSELSDTNRGNFLELLSLRCNDSAFLKDRLDSLLQNKKHGQWTSGITQNEIIDLLADFVCKRIVTEITSKVGGKTYIGVICDETSDISRHEQISLVISYVDSEGQKRESFLGFIKTDKTDGETLFNLIKESIRNFGLDMMSIVGLGFDGASNMNGPNKGVAARFKEDSPMSLYVHCYGHLLNLAVKDCLSSLPLLRNTLGIVQSLYVFLEASPKRHAIFVNTEMNAVTSLVRTLKSLSATRWSANYESVKGVDEEFERIIKCLWTIVHECDAKASSEAKSLLSAILDFEFLFGLHVLKVILPSTSKLSSYIQGTSIDIRKVKRNSELTIRTLESCRDEENFGLIWKQVKLRQSKIEQLLNTEDIDIVFKDCKLPVRRPSKRHQALLGESSSANTAFTDIESHYRINIYYTAMDKIITELKSRFAENENVILCALDKLVFESNVDDDSFRIVSEFYMLDKDLLKAEHRIYSQFKVGIRQVFLIKSE